MSQQVIGIGASPNDDTGDPLRTAYNKANANFTELYSGLFTRYYDVIEYGAVFDGVTDISTGVQAAVDAARTFMSAGNFRSAVIVFPPNAGLQQLGSTLNFTGFTNTANRLIVNWNLTGVFAKMNGTPAIDALGSVCITWNGVHIDGGSSPTPNVGVQIGRVNTTALNGGGSSMIFNQCRIVGNFTLAPLYNFSGEACAYYNCQFANTQASATSYAAVFDGINHFGVTSAFVTQLAPANTPQSFNQNLFVRCSFTIGNAAETSVIWKSGCRQHEYQSCYAAGQVSSYLFTEYCVSGTGGVSQNNKYDFHFEGNGVTLGSASGYFFLDGTLANPVFGGFELKTAFIFANHGFKINGSSSITAVTVNNLRLNMSGEITLGNSGTFQVFDNPTPWTVTGGRVDVISAAYWNLPSNHSVTVNGVPYITCDMA